MRNDPRPEAEYGHDVARRKPRVFGTALSFVVAYVDIRAAVAVAALTYASAGRGGVLSLIAWSLLYFGLRESIAKWARAREGATAAWLYLIDGAPDFLALGVLALVISVFLGHSAIESRAYPLRILLIVSTLYCLLSLSMDLRRLFEARRESGSGDRQEKSEIGYGVIGTDRGGADGWKIMGLRARLLLVASHFLNSILWTWLIIYYRYFRVSFLGESSWVMAALWIFLASCWVGCVAVPFSAYQSIKDSRVPHVPLLGHGRPRTPPSLS